MNRILQFLLIMLAIVYLVFPKIKENGMERQVKAMMESEFDAKSSDGTTQNAYAVRKKEGIRTWYYHDLSVKEIRPAYDEHDETWKALEDDDLEEMEPSRYLRIMEEIMQQDVTYGKLEYNGRTLYIVKNIDDNRLQEKGLLQYGEMVKACLTMEGNKLCGFSVTVFPQGQTEGEQFYLMVSRPGDYAFIMY